MDTLELIKKCAKLKGAKLVGIKGYKNSKGEISNQIINVNIDIMKAKEKDLETLKSFEPSKLAEIALKVGATMEEGNLALSEMIIAAEKNLSKDLEERTAHSKGQSEAYTHITKGIKFHNETGEIFLIGFAHRKKILVKGTYPKVNSKPKTLVKNEINKILKMYKYRNLKISNIIENVNITGSTIQV